MRAGLGVCLLLCFIARYRATALTEHKVHNKVLYPDKESWCTTTGIKQIVAYPGCSSVEIDNNVCVGACYSYNVPRTIPSAPGEMITPYCDSCQPSEFEWKDVTLTCTDESEEDEGVTDMTKRVQVITNCTCSACSSLYEKKSTDHHKHVGGGHPDDVPELMSLMTRKKEKEKEKESKEEDEGEVTTTQSLPAAQEESKKTTIIKDKDDLENLIEYEEDEKRKLKDSDDDEDGKSGADILRLTDDDKESTEEDHRHYEVGPHHTLVLKLDESHPKEPWRHHKRNDDEEVPSLLHNQFKIHDNEEYLDQIAVESIRKELSHPVVTVPDMIYQGKENKSAEDWKNGGTMLEVQHEHLHPAVEGVQLSYFGKSDEKHKLETLDDE